MVVDAPLVFVVDDEPAMLDIVTFALETQGFMYQSFRSAEAAWTAMRNTTPDLVVLDVMLPGVSESPCAGASRPALKYRSFC